MRSFRKPPVDEADYVGSVFVSDIYGPVAGRANDNDVPIPVELTGPRHYRRLRYDRAGNRRAAWVAAAVLGGTVAVGFATFWASGGSGDTAPIARPSTDVAAGRVACKFIVPKKLENGDEFTVADLGIQVHYPLEHDIASRDRGFNFRDIHVGQGLDLTAPACVALMGSGYEDDVRIILHSADEQG
jgi:hypothetical protein